MAPAKSQPRLPHLSVLTTCMAAMAFLGERYRLPYRPPDRPSGVACVSCRTAIGQHDASTCAPASNRSTHAAQVQLP